MELKPQALVGLGQGPVLAVSQLQILDQLFDLLIRWQALKNRNKDLDEDIQLEFTAAKKPQLKFDEIKARPPWDRQADRYQLPEFFE